MYLQAVAGLPVRPGYIIVSKKQLHINNTNGQ